MSMQPKGHILPGYPLSDFPFDKGVLFTNQSKNGPLFLQDAGFSLSLKLA